MCLAVVALNAHPRYCVVIAANRDEYHARPAVPAHWWSDVESLAGRDLEAGGTWLGVTRQGRWAFVTNVREPGGHDPSARSRGALVPTVLGAAVDVPEALAEIQLEASRYNGFNLLAGRDGDAYWISNRYGGAPARRESLPVRNDVHRLADGVHGISNAQLDTPWPKLNRVKSGVAAWAARGESSVEALFGLLFDRECAGDDELPATGIPLARERLLSSPFIVSGDYGTRCSTVLAVTREGEVTFIERSFDAAGELTGEVAHAFALETAT